MLTNVSNTVFWVVDTLSLQISADPVSKFPDVTHWHGTGIKQAHAQDHNNEPIPKYRHPHMSTATRWAEAVALSEGFNSLSN